jgi:ferredoxin--NADP+ reductase
LFHHAPRELAGGERVEGVVFSGRTIPAQLVIFATGQRGDAMEGLPFDAGAGIIPNDRGRVAGVKGVYVCGWIKRGAKGLIGHNRKDAIETVARIVEDFTPPSP